MKEAVRELVLQSQRKERCTTPVRSGAPELRPLPQLAHQGFRAGSFQ